MKDAKLLIEPITSEWAAQLDGRYLVPIAFGIRSGAERTKNPFYSEQYHFCKKNPLPRPPRQQLQTKIRHNHKISRQGNNSDSDKI